MEKEIQKDVGKDVEFTDENGLKATMHIESTMGYKIDGLNNSSRYKLANLRKESKLVNENKKMSFLTKDIGPKIKGDGFFTRDIGIKSNGFAQVAFLSFAVAFAILLVMFIMFRY